jgi:hypothetical protein
MAKLSKGGFPRAVVEEWQHPMKKPCAKVREEKKWGFEFPWHNKVNPAILRHPTILCENQTDCWLICPNLTAKNSHTLCRRKGKGIPQPKRAPPRPKSRPVPSDDDESCETDGMPPTYVYTHTLLERRHMTRSRVSARVCHQQKTFPSGRNGCVRVDALRQSRQRHPGGG